MSIEILVPPLSQTMDSMVLVEWLKKTGEPVQKGEILFRAESDKATLDIESPGTGIVYEILAEPGDEILIRSSIGTILEPGEEPPAASGGKGTAEEKLQAKEKPQASAQPSLSIAKNDHQFADQDWWAKLPAHRQERIFASPRARHLSETEDVSLANIKPSGTQNTIVERDVSAYLQQMPTTPIPDITPVARRMAESMGIDLDKLAKRIPDRAITRADIEAAVNQQMAAPVATTVANKKTTSTPALGSLSPLRRQIARRMSESHSLTAPVTLSRQVDATLLFKLRERLLKHLPEDAARPTLTDFLVSISCRALLQHPQLNAHFDGSQVTIFSEVHMALAVDTEAGLVAPVIFNAHQKSIPQLAQERGKLAKEARQGSLPSEMLSGGTFTLTNMGPAKIDVFTPIINLPQVAILGVGRFEPAVKPDKDKLRSCMLGFLSLTFDHRVLDGIPAAKFLDTIATMVENPDSIWLFPPASPNN